MDKPGIPPESHENHIKRLETRIDGLEWVLHNERACGRALPDYQEKTVCEIRVLFPKESSYYPDSAIARAYSMYCETNHGAGWTKTDLHDFGKWAFCGAMTLYGYGWGG